MKTPFESIFCFVATLYLITKNHSKAELDILGASLIGKSTNNNPTEATPTSPKPTDSSFSTSNMTDSKGGKIDITRPGDYPPCKSLCPAKINIGWLDWPPYIQAAKATQNGTTKHGAVTGIFHDVIKGTLNICCSMKRACGHKVSLNYSDPEKEEFGLNMGLVDGTYDVILPVHSGKEAGSYATYPYTHVLDTPGLILVTGRNRLDEVRKGGVIRVLGDTWPVITITFLLTAIAGMSIWALDTYWNPEEFPRPFARGALEGCWWAFVTMTTVGYGDRAPKSCFARLFGVLWITVGLAICSFLTATLTSAITALSVKEEMENLIGKKIGVADPFGFDVAVKRGAHVEVYNNIEKAYRAMIVDHVIDGLLLEIYSGENFLSRDNRLDSAHISHVIYTPYSVGLAVTKDRQVWPTWTSCLDLVLRHKQKEVVAIVAKHTASNKGLGHRSESVASEIIRIIDPSSGNVRSVLFALSVVVGAMCMLGATYEMIRRSRIRNRVLITEKGPRDSLDSQIRELDHNIKVLNSELIKIKTNQMYIDDRQTDGTDENAF